MAVSTSALDLRDVLAHVLRGRAREFVCDSCGQTARMLVTLGPYGRLPVKCEECEPHSQAWVRERESRPLRELVLHLYERLMVAEELLRPEPVRASSRRESRYGEPGRESLVLAVRAVAEASSRDGQLEALYDLSAVAQGWARRIGP